MICTFKNAGKRRGKRVLLCDFCGRSLNTNKPPEVIVRSCPCTNRELTAAGKLLICIRPGERVATIAKFAGADGLAKAWEEITGQPCKCSNRRAWLDAQWELLVWRGFSAPLSRPACRA